MIEAAPLLPQLSPTRSHPQCHPQGALEPLMVEVEVEVASADFLPEPVAASRNFLPEPVAASMNFLQEPVASMGSVAEVCHFSNTTPHSAGAFSKRHHGLSPLA